MTTAPPPLPLAVPAGARCIVCGYALEALCQPRCPECGGGFDPSRPFTMRLPGAAGLGRAAARGTIRVLSGTTFLTMLILLLGWAAIIHPFPLVLALLTLLVAGALGRRTAVV